MPNSIISEGNTTNEAIEKGLKILNVSKNMVNIKVLENEEKRSFFSILAPRVVKVELTLKENAEKHAGYEEKKDSSERKKVSKEDNEKAKQNVDIFLKQFLIKFGENVKYDIKTDEFGLDIQISGGTTGTLIGYRGETLYAMQSLLSAIASKNCDDRIRILLDIESYKVKREKTIQDLAIRIAKNVEKTGKTATLEPMHAYERKIIHSTLQDSNTVKTESIGEEPRRRVVISLK